MLHISRFDTTIVVYKGPQADLVKPSCGNSIRGAYFCDNAATVSVHNLAFWGQIPDLQKPALQHNACESSILSRLAKMNGPYWTTSALHCTPEDQKKLIQPLTSLEISIKKHIHILHNLHSDAAPTLEILRMRSKPRQRGFGHGCNHSTAHLAPSPATLQCTVFVSSIYFNFTSSHKNTTTLTMILRVSPNTVTYPTKRPPYR